MKIGYARVSTLEQNLDAQIDQLEQYGCEKIYREKTSGGSPSRPMLDEMFNYLRPGDTVVVVKLDRLSRSLKDLLELTARINENGADFESITEKIDTGSPHGKLIFHVFGVIAEFERDRIRQRTMEGLAAARARGRNGGRSFALNRDQRDEVVKLRREGRSLSELSRLFGVIRATIARTCEISGAIASQIEHFRHFAQSAPFQYSISIRLMGDLDVIGIRNRCGTQPVAGMEGTSRVTTTIRGVGGESRNPRSATQRQPHQ